MFDKILIANRGEIACRIIGTAKRMGISTVAVYSDFDINALHVRNAEEAFAIGPAAANESYLNIDAIMAVAQKSGAQAIHPGYGFLSENATFAKACEDKNVTFIGAPTAAIQSMGSKSAAKSIMEAAGVPLVPGYHGDKQESDYLRRKAEEIGFPVLIKASAGGGGKGMRIVHSDDEFEVQLTSARREALSAFADQNVLIEKYLTSPRHIEVQIFADQHGNTVHLHERDCSIQRRHQKVIEEAPAPGLNQEQRQKLGEIAIRAAQAVNYVGAGTVEFIQQDHQFYFMEMNTRLQVEHPVTEMITGLDLVEWQIRVAAHQPLPLKQEHIVVTGHAMEARIYAESPENDFLPSTGTLNILSFPETGGNIRVDTGVSQHDSIGIHYDPMIAKMISWAPDRNQAASALIKALSATRITGLQTNIRYLRNISQHRAFRDGTFDTTFADKFHDELNALPAPNDFVYAFTAVFAHLSDCHRVSHRGYELREFNSPWSCTNSWRMNHHAQTRIQFEPDGDLAPEVSVTTVDDGYRAKINDAIFKFTQISQIEDCFEFFCEDQKCLTYIVEQENTLYVFYNGEHYSLHRHNVLANVDRHSTDTGGFNAPMPGKIIAVKVKTNDRVNIKDALVVMEAMKMEHTVTATYPGTVECINVSVGDQVEENAPLIVIKAHHLDN